MRRLVASSVRNLNSEGEIEEVVEIDSFLLTQMKHLTMLRRVELV